MSVELSRRLLLQAGGALGLLYLTGCKAKPGGGGDGLVAGDPEIPWPELPSVPGGRAVRGTYYPAPAEPGPFAPGGPVPPVPGVVPLPTGVIPRREWTRAGVARPGSINAMNGISRLTVHHDGMNVFTSTGYSQCAARVEQIRLSHNSRNATGGGTWADIGYHYIIDAGGRVWEGRSTAYQGAHVQDKNEHNLGVLCMGNFEQQSPTSAQMAQLDRFIASQMRQYNIPLSRVYTHRELNPTECPGRNLQQYMVRTRSRGGGLALAAGEPGGVRGLG
ncbi:MAG: peptidoglycan recognition family protein [bacterium]